MLGPGKLVSDRYRLERLVGTGGMGAVWVAKHLGLDSEVAVKFQHVPLASAPGAAERFQREARVAAQLRSPHVVRIHDYGVDDGIAFIVMELLEGESLRARLDSETRVTPREASNLLRQAASAIDLAHARGVVHRDIKPSNLFLAREGDHEILKLLDFGIAKWTDSNEATASSAVVGSVRYMSPEQARGLRVDHRTDVWSLGVVAYEMLTGEAPFAGASMPDTTVKISSGEFQLPSLRLGLSYQCFDAVFERAFRVRAEERLASAGELAEAFGEAARAWKGQSSSVDLGRVGDTATMRATVSARQRGAARSRSGVWTALAGAGLLAALGAWFLARGKEAPVVSAIEEPRSATATSTMPAASVVKLPAPAPGPSALAGSSASAVVSVAPAIPARPTRELSRLPRARRPDKPSAGEPAVTEPVKPSPPPSRSDPDFGLDLPAAR